MFSVVTNADEFVVSAVQQVLDDFQIKSPVATAAQQVASIFIEWAKMADNKGSLKKFCDEVIRNLETVFIDTIKSTVGSIVNRDKLWRNFFLLRSSTSYQQKWEDYVVRKVFHCTVLPARHRCTVSVDGKIALPNRK